MRQSSAQFGYDDDGSRLATDRQGSLAARELVVRQYGQEVLRTAYLLIDDRKRAWSIARAAFIDLFRDLPKLETDADVRVRLLIHTGRIFLSPPLPDDEVRVPLSMPLEGAPARFHVDDSRSRTRAALQLVDPPLRLALVLRDFNGLEVEPIGTLTQKRVDVLTVSLETARRRVRSYVDLPPHESLRGTLTTAAFDAPAGNLWGDLASDAEELLKNADSRARMATTGVLVAVALVLIVALVALFGNSPDEDVVAETQTNAVNDPAPFPTIVPPRLVPTPGEQAADAVSTEIVPDTLLIALEDVNAADGLANTSAFRPQSSIALRPITQWLRPAREEWPPLLSPDGRQLFIARYESGSSETSLILAALDSSTFAENWSTELATWPGSMSLDRKPDLLVSMALDAEHVYASLHQWDSGTPIRVVAFDQQQGQLASEWPVNLAGFAGSDVRIVIPPGGDRLHLFAIIGDGATIGGQMQLAFFSFQLPDGDQIYGKSLIEGSNSRVFYIYQGNVTVDGRSMYGLTHNGNSATLEVQFFDLASASLQRSVPIRFRVEGTQMPLHEAVAHDGRWLYVFSSLSAEMAIVDLQTRSLLGIIPLDVQTEIGNGPDPVYPRDNTMSVSPDGTRIYLIGATTDGTSTTSGVWVIDTSTWTLADHWLPQSNPDQLLLSGDGQTLYLHALGDQADTHPAGTLWAIDTDTGEEISTNGLSFLPDSTGIQLQMLDAIYRQQFGRSPNLEGVQPVDNRAFSSLPSVDAAITPDLISPGEEITISVSFLDPFSRDLVVEGAADSRFEPASGVRAVLSNTEGAASDIILELGRLGYAEYSATVVLPRPGEWTLSIVNDWSGTQATPHLLKTSARVDVLTRPPGISTGSFNVAPEGDPGYYSPAPPDDP